MSDYPNSGALFRNDRKREGKRDPDRNGACETTCPACGAVTAWWVNGWLKTGSKGEFLSLSLKPKDAATRPQPNRQSATTTGAGPATDDVPF